MQFISIQSLPTLNAILNATSGVLIVTGFILIKRKRIAAHRACMISAVITSILFLISYLTYHYYHGVTRFAGTGIARPVYFFILTTHTFLAAVIVPFVAVTLTRGLKRHFVRHRKIARWTFPMWLYVSVTGVVVYVMLYHIFPSAP